MTFLALKDPQAVLNYSVRWHEWLGSGETISASTWSITGPESPIALAVDSDTIGDYTGQSPILSNTVATVIISGGTAGVTYTLTNHIITSEGIEDDRSITIKVQNK